MSKKKEQILFEFEEKKLTGSKALEYKKIQKETVLWPLLRACIIGVIGWFAVLFFLYFYLPEMFESKTTFLKTLFMGPVACFLIFLMCMFQLWLESFGKSKYVITDKTLKYESFANCKIIKWKNIDCYEVKEKQSIDDDTVTVLLYRKNKRIRPFTMVVPQESFDKVMEIIVDRFEPLREVLPDRKLVAIKKLKEVKSMLLFSIIVGLLAGLLLDIENLRFLKGQNEMLKLHIFVLGPGTLWLLIFRIRKILDPAYLSLAFFGNMTGNGIMFFVLIIKYLRQVFDMAK